MKFNRDVNNFLQRTYQLISLIRNKKSCHILDTERICSHIFHALRHIGPVIQCVRITQCIGQSNLCMSFLLVGCSNCGLKIAKIIQTVKNTNNIDTISNGLLYKVLYNIICIRTISQNILSTKQHLKLCVLKSVS